MSNRKSQQQTRELMGTESEFLKIFNRLIGTKNAWQVWEDVITAMACTLSNAFDPDEKRKESREKEYLQAIKGYDTQTIAELFAIVVTAFDRNPDQDFLGAMYMNLNLGSHWHGQFFTPYNICQVMSRITIDKERVCKQVEEHGWIGISDPSCGAGATLVSAANELRRMDINYQERCLFVGQDIDRVVAKMCFIQLSLLGCPGYIAVANTLTNPITGDTLEPHEKEGQEFWYTPFYWADIWTGRRICRRLDLQARAGKKTPEKEDRAFMFFFPEEKGVAI